MYNRKLKGKSSDTMEKNSRNMDITFFILLFSAMATMAYGFPGHVHFDAVIQLYEGTTGKFTSFAPPVLSTIWAFLYYLGSGVWTIVVVDVCLLIAGIWLVVRGAPWANGMVVLAVALIAWSPIIINHQAVVVKDVSFANFAIFGFLLLHFCVTRAIGQFGSLATIALVSTALFWLTLAALSRPQGLACLTIGGAVGAYAIYRVILQHSEFWKRFTASALAVISCILILYSSMAALPNAIAQGRPADSFRVGLILVMLYDIAGMAYRDSDVDFEILKNTGFDVPNFKRIIKEKYTGERIDYMSNDTDIWPKTFVTPPGAEPFRVLFSSVARTWVKNIIHHFPAYVDHRLDSFSWLLGLYGEQKCIPVYVGVADGPEGMREKIGLEQRINLRNGEIYGTLMSLIDYPFYQHWFYLIATLFELSWIAVTYRRGDEAAIGLAISALVVTFSFLPIGIACDFRYLYFPLMASLCLPLLILTRRPIDQNLPANLV